MCKHRMSALVFLMFVLPATTMHSIAAEARRPQAHHLIRELELGEGNARRRPLDTAASVDRVNGVYRMDRWGVHHFDSFEVGAALQSKLQPHACKALTIEAPRIEAGRVLSGAGAIRPLPETARLTLSFLDPARKLSTKEQQDIEALIKQLTSPVYRVRQQAHDELARLDTGVLPLLQKAEAGAQQLELLRRLQRVIEAIEIGPASGTVTSEHLQRFDVARKIRLKLTVTNTSATEMMSYGKLYLRLASGVTGAIANLADDRLAPGESKVRVFEFAGFEPYESECFARVYLTPAERDAADLRVGRLTDMIFESNALRMDGLIEKSLPDQGLVFELARARTTTNDTRLRVSMRNTSASSLRIALDRNDHGWDFSRHVLYYDRQGQLIDSQLPFARTVRQHLLLPAKGEVSAFVQPPAATAYARVAFEHPYHFTRTGEPRNLPNGVYTSAALLFDEDEEVQECPEAADRPMCT